MSDIGLIPYAFFMERRGRRQSYLNLSDFGGQFNGRHLILSFLDYLKQRQHEVEDGIQRTFQLIEFYEDNGCVYGTILAGYYGEPGALINAQTGETTHVKTPEEADAKSYFFYIDIPNRPIGEYIFILQAYDFHGIKTEIHDRLNEFIDMYEEGEVKRRYTFSLDLRVPASYLTYFMEEVKIKKLRFIQKFGHMNVEGRQSPVHIEMQVSPPRTQSMQLNHRLIQWVNGTIPTIQGVFSLPDEGSNFTYQDVKIEGLVGGRRTTLSIENLKLPRFAFHIKRDTLKTDSRGYFTPESFVGEADTIVHRLRAEMAANTPVPEDEREQE